MLRAFSAHPELQPTLIHSGQHYDKNLSDIFFDQLEMQKPDVHLEVGSGSHASQTAKVLERMEEVLLAGPANGGKFDRLIVVGDVNSTMAATLAAAKLHIPVAHVEAGLRSGDRGMPEEINRLVTDAVADMLLVSEPEGVENLRSEGRPDECIELVGNVMIDTLRQQLEAAQALGTLNELGMEPTGYALVTLHRPSNVDHVDVLTSLVEVLIDLADQVPVVFPIHPRTEARLKEFGLFERLTRAKRIQQAPPLGYREFLCLSSQAKVIITDSGGLQEESTALGIPCLTMRSNTERPITVTEGTSTLIGSDVELLRSQLRAVLAGEYKAGSCPALWDGKASERIAQALIRECEA